MKTVRSNNSKKIMNNNNNSSDLRMRSHYLNILIKKQISYGHRWWLLLLNKIICTIKRVFNINCIN